MSDRVYALTVILEQPMKKDDIQSLIDAVKMMRHVQDVASHIANSETYFAMSHARVELGHKLWEVLYPKPDKQTT
jgi:3-methyladenine DNA glycosylase Tag